MDDYDDCDGEDDGADDDDVGGEADGAGCSTDPPPTSSSAPIDVDPSARPDRPVVDGVTWHRVKRRWIGHVWNPLTKKKEHTSPFPDARYDECVTARAALRARIDAACAAANVTRRVTAPAAKKAHGGLKWDGKKWQGQAPDPWTGKKIHVGMYADTPGEEARGVAAVAAKRAALVAAYDAAMEKRALDDPLTDGLPRAPADATDAVAEQVYWHVSGKTDPPHTPYRVVKSGETQYERACHECPSHAIPRSKGGNATHCVAHGGGCPHGTKWSACRECNPNAKKQVNNCSSCAKRLNKKRRTTKGGNGLCPDCDVHLTAEAKEAGSAPPPAGERWENVVLDKLVTLVVDLEGKKIAYESRDDMRNMLGSNGKRRRGECSTAHQRRPDLLYLVRDADAHLVACLFVEVDEHSHSDREPSCEAGKVDEEFQSLLQLAQTEGMARHAVARREVRTPYVLFLKFNPNTCDAPGGAIPLETRIKVLAKRCCDFLTTPTTEFHALSDAGKAMAPHVEALYYHSVKGKANLDYFDARATGAWDWRGNACPRA